MELKQDYKIATKTIALRLEEVLEHDSVHPTQTDYHLKKKTYVTASMLTLKRFFTKSNSKKRRSG